MSRGKRRAHSVVNTGGEVFSTGGVAELVGISQQSVIRECDRESLVCYRVPGSTYRRITRGELVAWAERNNLPLDLPPLAAAAATESLTGGGPHDAGRGETEGGAGNAGQTPGEQGPDGGRAGGEQEDGLQPTRPLG